MLIQIHCIQNHSPANLNRDDLGSPKTCFFGGVLRSRISSQCLKRSIRMSEHFRDLLGGVRTRQLGKLIAEKAGVGDSGSKRAEKVLVLCGFLPKQGRKTDVEETSDKSKMLVYTTYEAIELMSQRLCEDGLSDKELAKVFAQVISEHVAVPDMALAGRMLEPDKTARDVWKELDTTVEAALQVAHAISTHEARPEVDYYVAADDVPGEDSGAGYVDEAMFSSACFYKYFSIDWQLLVKNLAGNEPLAAHTVGAFIRSAAMSTPTGKQNSFAAHNPPDGILVEVRKAPISYGNAFAVPTTGQDRGVIAQSIAQLAQYVHDLDIGYGKPEKRLWFSPNLRYQLNAIEGSDEIALAEEKMESLDKLIRGVVSAVGQDWDAVRKVTVSSGVI